MLEQLRYPSRCIASWIGLLGAADSCKDALLSNPVSTLVLCCTDDL